MIKHILLIYDLSISHTSHLTLYTVGLFLVLPLYQVTNESLEVGLIDEFYIEQLSSLQSWPDEVSSEMKHCLSTI